MNNKKDPNRLKECPYCHKLWPRTKLNYKQGTLSCEECNEWAERISKLLGARDE